VELLAEHSAIQPGQNFQVGLKFQLEKGWHIYWTNPGDAGQPPRVTWELPAGLRAGSILWPYPKVLSAFSAVDFGYEDEALLLVPMQASGSLNHVANLNADLKVVICQDVCIPGKAKLSLSLPVASHAPSANSSTQGVFNAARQKLPMPAPASWKFQAKDSKDSFYLAGIVGRPIKEAFFFPLEESQIENAAPQKIQPSKTGFGVELKKSNQLTSPIQHLRGVLLLTDKAYVIDVPVK
jgi:thiol:disulfide interchange protein DsbD